MLCYIVDSFTDSPFRGNPAGVCLVEQTLSDEQMLLVAAELNLSETAFVGAAHSDGAFPIRFFSPKQEIPLCGHATLASAKVLMETKEVPAVSFLNVQGLELTTRKSAGAIEMTLPAYTLRPAEAPPALLAALGITSCEHIAFNRETGILMLEIADVQQLAALEPDFAALHRSHDSIQGVLVTAASGDDGYDFHSRYFWPWSGSDEDPVTGGTHTFLTGYWAARLGKTKLRSFQASKRGGSMEVELDDDRILIRGQAVIVLEGRMPLFDS